MEYAYDQLSRLTAEQRTFSGLGSYNLTYSYNRAGALTGIGTPWNASVGQRLTDTSGNMVANATIELDPFGGETCAMSNNRQSHVFTTYERDGAGMDEAGARKYHGWWSRFDQPDPYDGSYNMSDPQSFNRYSYVQNDPVNLVDPSGLKQVCVKMNDGSTFCYDDKTDVVRSDSFAQYWLNNPFVGMWGWGPRHGERAELIMPVMPLDSSDGGGGGIGGGGGNERTGEDSSDKCDALRNEIANLTQDVLRRHRQQTRNKGNLPETGKNSLAGHLKQFKQDQGSLQDAIDEFISSGCSGGLPSGAKEAATMPDPVPRRRNTGANFVTPGRIASGVSIGVGAYAVYRIIRLIPSVAAPPLWWTIPFNLAAP